MLTALELSTFQVPLSVLETLFTTLPLVLFNSLPEFLAMMSRATRVEDTDEELRRAFQVFDRDNSGTISTEELRDVLRSIGENLTDSELDEMMHQVDVDGNGTIDCKYYFCMVWCLLEAYWYTSNS